MCEISIQNFYAPVEEEADVKTAMNGDSILWMGANGDYRALGSIIRIKCPGKSFDGKDSFWFEKTMDPYTDGMESGNWTNLMELHSGSQVFSKLEDGKVIDIPSVPMNLSSGDSCGYRKLEFGILLKIKDSNKHLVILAEQDIVSRRVESRGADEEELREAKLAEIDAMPEISQMSHFVRFQIHSCRIVENLMRRENEQNPDSDVYLIIQETRLSDVFNIGWGGRKANSVSEVKTILELTPTAETVSDTFWPDAAVYSEDAMEEELEREE